MRDMRRTTAPSVAAAVAQQPDERSSTRSRNPRGSGDRLRIRDTRGAVATHSYTLAGSRNALTKLMAQCR